MAEGKTTLRDLINELEKLADKGNNDNLPVMLMDNDEDCYDIGYIELTMVHTPLTGGMERVVVIAVD